MESLGNELKVMREQKGLTLEQIAAETRISAHYLQSLEEGRYSELPGGMYNRAFLRAYCNYLGMDSQAAMERLETELMPPVEKPARSKVRLPQPASSSRSHTLLAWSAMLLISITGLYFTRNWMAAIFAPYFSSPAERPLVSPSPPAPPEAAPPVPQDVFPASLSSGDETPLSLSSAALEAAPEIPVAETLPAVPATLRIELQALETCWLYVKTDGGQSTSILLEPGKDQTFDASDQIYLILGNAGGVQLKINGRLARPLGKSGEVVKMLINQQNLNDLTPDAAG